MPFPPRSDYAYQQNTPITPAFELLPGDSLVTRCVWDSTKKWHVSGIDCLLYALLGRRVPALGFQWIIHFSS